LTASRRGRALDLGRVLRTRRSSSSTMAVAARAGRRAGRRRRRVARRTRRWRRAPDSPRVAELAHRDAASPDSGVVIHAPLGCRRAVPGVVTSTCRTSETAAPSAKRVTSTAPWQGAAERTMRPSSPVSMCSPLELPVTSYASRRRRHDSSRSASWPRRAGRRDDTGGALRDRRRRHVELPTGLGGDAS